MLALARLGLNHGNLMAGAISPQASRERSGHVPQLIVIEVRVAAVELPPPRAEPPTGLAHRKVGVEHHAIHAIVGSLQQLRVITGQLIGRIHPPKLNPGPTLFHGCSLPTNHLFPAQVWEKAPTPASRDPPPFWLLRLTEPLSA